MAKPSTALVRKLETQVKTLKSKSKTTAAQNVARRTDAMTDGEVFGVSIDIAGCLLCVGAGIASKQPYLIAFGAGLIADTAREKGFELANSFMSGRVAANGAPIAGAGGN